LLLRAHDTGFSVTQIVLLYALFNTVCVIAAPLVGLLGDRVGRSSIVSHWHRFVCRTEAARADPQVMINCRDARRRSLKPPHQTTVCGDP